jgi:ABC-type lipoprotein export system ATPase subunit
MEKDSEIKYIVETVDLAKHYGDGEKVKALDGVSLQIPEGQFVSVMGPSGSGKSTLLHLVGALDRPTLGKVIINGEDLEEVKNLDRFRNNTVGFVFQLHNLIPTLTALENVEVPLYEQKISARERKKRAEHLLEIVGLGDRLKHLPSQLSGGQRQRVAVARSLVNEPALVLADEPTGELDSERAAEIIEMLHRLNKELGTTFIIVTHDPAVAQQTDRIIELDSGRIIRDHLVGNTFDEDWKYLRSSSLGQAIVEESQGDLAVNGVILYQDGAPTGAGILLKKLLLS